MSGLALRTQISGVNDMLSGGDSQAKPIVCCTTYLSDKNVSPPTYAASARLAEPFPVLC